MAWPLHRRCGIVTATHDCPPTIFRQRRAELIKDDGEGFYTVYTCQKPQPKRCKFFLWEDDAQTREKQTVLANTRSEPDTPKKQQQSPTKNSTTQNGGLLTPGTGRPHQSVAASRRRDDITQTPTKIRRTQPGLSSDEDTYSWDDSLENEVDDLMASSSRPTQPVFAPSTPSKTPRTAAINTSPSKRKFEDLDDQPPPYSETTPSSQSHTTISTVPFSSVDVSTTPTPRRYRDVLTTRDPSHESELSLSILSIFDRHDVVVPTAARDEVAGFLDQQHLKTQGIVRGRDISRMALKKKDEEIKSLKERIERMETEREMDRAVISCLKSDK